MRREGVSMRATGPVTVFLAALLIGCGGGSPADSGADSGPADTGIGSDAVFTAAIFGLHICTVVVCH